MTSLDQPSDARRRWMMPIILLLVAGAIGVWSAQQSVARREEVRQHVANLVQSVCAGQGASTMLRAPSDEFEVQVLEALRRLCSDASPSVPPTVAVAQGDVSDAGSHQGTATHVATLSTAGGHTLRLRIKHDAGTDAITVIGYIRMPDEEGRPES